MDSKTAISHNAQTVPIYCISFNNPPRKERMMARFEQLGLPCTFIDPIPPTDPQIVENIEHEWLRRQFSAMMNHLKMMALFVESGASHGIFCEDDIYLKRTFKEDLPYIVHDFDRMELDILLLGYLISEKLVFPRYPPKTKYTYHNYPDDNWGSQMYMLSRKHALVLLEKFSFEQGLILHKTIPYTQDFTITKTGNRACIYPLIGVEEGEVNGDHQGQILFHQKCAAIHYDPDLYL